MKIFLYIWHQSLQKLNKSNVSCLILYSYHLDTVNTNPNNMFGYLIDNEEEFSDEESKDELIKDDEEKEFQFDWMRLAEMRYRSKS